MKEATNENPYSLPYKLAADKIAKKEVLSSIRRDHQNFARTVTKTIDLLLHTLIPLDMEGQKTLSRLA